MRYPLLIVMPLCFMPTVHASAVIRVDWTGSVYDSNVPGIARYDSITGSFSYTDSAPVSVSGVQTNGAHYRIYDTQHESSFSVNGLSGSRTGNQIYVRDNVSGYDQFDSRGFAPNSYSGDLLGGYEVQQIFVMLNGWDVLSSAELPSAANPIEPDDWAGHGLSRLQLTDVYSHQGPNVRFIVSSFTFTAMTPVPEPSSAVLFGVGLLGFLSVVRRRNEKT